MRLVQRTTRSVGLTEAGELFVTQLRPSLDGVATAFESIGELRDGPAGTLRLNVPRLGYERVLEPLLRALGRRSSPANDGKGDARDGTPRRATPLPWTGAAVCDLLGDMTDEPLADPG